MGEQYLVIEVTRDLVQTCVDNGIEAKGCIFSTNPDKLKRSIGYVRNNYGEDYVQRLIVCQNPERLKKILPYLESKEYLGGLLKGTAILSLTFDEVIERENFLKERGEQVLIDGKFNPVFGWTRKKFKNVKNNVASSGRGK